MSPGFGDGYAEVNGVRLHYKAAGAGKLIVFLHGFPEFWYCWRRQIEHFGADHLALAPDMRGYNLSDRPAEVAQYRAKLLIEDIRQLARAFSADTFVLVAHDWGGAIAWGLAIAHPELLSHLVIVNSPHPYAFWRELANNPAQAKASEYMLLLRDPKAEHVLSGDGYERLLKMRFGAGNENLYGDTERRAYIDAWSQPGALTGSLNYYRASPLYPPAPGDAGAAKLKLDPRDFHVRVPTLIIWGEKDKALLPSILDGIEEMVESLEVVRVPDATHWVLDEKPNLVNAEIRRFIGMESAA